MAFLALAATLGALWDPARAAASDQPASAGASAALALRAVERSETRRAFDPALTADLALDERLATRAALALGRIGDAAGVPPLRAQLADERPGVRAACAYALGLLAARAAAADLMRLARTDENSAVRYAAVDALGRLVAAEPALGRDDVATVLVATLFADVDPVVRAHAAAQFDVFTLTPHAARLVNALTVAVRRDPAAAVRWHAMWAVFRGFARQADARFLRDALEDPAELVRIEAARAWGRRSDAPRAALLRASRADPSWRVRYEALEALRRAEGRGATEHLSAIPATVQVPARPAPLGPAIMPLPAPSGPPVAPDPATVPLPPLAFPTSAAAMNRPPGRHPEVLLRTTQGDVVVRLYPEWAPVTVANFLALAGRGYYDGNRWFRVVPDFVVQTGDPHDDPDGSAGYTIGAELNPLEQRAGVIAMGLDYENGAAKLDSASAQYYLTLSPQLHLDRAFTAFGEVARGFDVLGRLVERDRVLAIRRLADG